MGFGKNGKEVELVRCCHCGCYIAEDRLDEEYGYELIDGEIYCWYCAERKRLPKRPLFEVIYDSRETN